MDLNQHISLDWLKKQCSDSECITISFDLKRTGDDYKITNTRYTKSIPPNIEAPEPEEL